MSVTLCVLIFLFLCTLACFLFKYGRSYIKALALDAPVSVLQILGMALRNVDVRSVVENRITAKRVGIDIEPSSLETHYLAGGNVNNVIRALVAARKSNIDLSYERACTIDLAGRDVLEAIRTCINPKEIDCPAPEKECPSLEAITKDGIQLKLKARISVRTNIDKLVGGATEETIIARVGEAVITAVGSSDTYKRVLERPDLISKEVLDKGLDRDTGFKILAVTIVTITVGENVGAKLQAEQAEADKRIAQANAEKEQSIAFAREQEMKTLVQENKIKILAAEAEVTKAVAQAFREGNMGIMDFYHMKNIQADTEMKLFASQSESQKTT